MAMDVAVLGATGMMGGLVIKSALQAGHRVERKVSRQNAIGDLFAENIEVIIDFSSPIATEFMLKYALENDSNIPIVVATTGLSSMHIGLAREYSLRAPVFCAPNMSSLVSIVNMIVHALAKVLPEDEFDAEILDIHHKMKKDAPSGTAYMLGRSIAKARRRNFTEVANFLRFGILEPRKDGEIGFSSQRCSNVVGTHEVSFMSDLENVKVRHEANSKEVFSKGAIRAAEWLVKQPSGMYDMNDLTRDIMIPVMKVLYHNFFGK